MSEMKTKTLHQYSDALHSSQMHSLKWYPLKRYK